MSTIGLMLAAFLCYSQKTESSESAHLVEYKIAKRGGSVTLHCAPLYGNRTVWLVHWIKDGGILYNGVDVTDSVKYNISKGGLTFTISGVKASDAGTYRCIVTSNAEANAAKQGSSKTAELIILDSSVEWKANFSNTSKLKTNEVVVISCEFLYYGKFPPYLQCMTTQSKQTWYRSNLGHNETVSARNASLRLEISLEPYLNGQTIECVVDFMLEKYQNLTKRNVYLFPESWRTPVFNVLFKPSNLRLSPAAEFYDVGDTVKCEADGNPTSFEVQWVNLGTGSVVERSEIRLDASGTFRYVCNVTNAVGSSTNQFTIKVKANGTGKSTDDGLKNGRLTTVIAVSVTSALLTLAFAVTAIIVLCIKNRNIRQKLLDQQRYVGPVASRGEAPTTSTDLPTIYEDLAEDVAGQSTVQPDGGEYGEIPMMTQEEEATTTVRYTGLIQEDRVVATSAQPYTPLHANSAQEAASPEDEYDDLNRDDEEVTASNEDSRSYSYDKTRSKTSPDYVNYVDRAVATDAGV